MNLLRLEQRIRHIFAAAFDYVGEDDQWESVVGLMSRMVPVANLMSWSVGQNIEVTGENPDDFVWVGTDLSKFKRGGENIGAPILGEREHVNSIFAVHFRGMEQGSMMSYPRGWPYEGDPLDDYAIAEAFAEKAKEAFTIEPDLPPDFWN